MRHSLTIGLGAGAATGGALGLLAGHQLGQHRARAEQATRDRDVQDLIQDQIDINTAESERLAHETEQMRRAQAQMDIYHAEYRATQARRRADMQLATCVYVKEAALLEEAGLGTLPEDMRIHFEVVWEHECRGARPPDWAAEAVSRWRTARALPAESEFQVRAGLLADPLLQQQQHQREQREQHQREQREQHQREQREQHQREQREQQPEHQPEQQHPPPSNHGDDGNENGNHPSSFHVPWRVPAVSTTAANNAAHRLVRSAGVAAAAMKKSWRALERTAGVGMGMWMGMGERAPGWQRLARWERAGGAW
ncbi:MAG: hypothetical protein M1826_003319 [Phylliscum demangeonii]|nr:MAG: hypothetical protein M1826_003319 [Phylliscum demangeonii]